MLCLHLRSFKLLLLARAIESQLLLNCYPARNPHVDSVIMLWTASHNIPLPDNNSAMKQHPVDAPIIAADKASLWSSLTDSNNRARLLAVSSPHSGDWLHAHPWLHVEQDSTTRKFWKSACVNLSCAPVFILQAQCRQINRPPPAQ